MIVSAVNSIPFLVSFPVPVFPQGIVILFIRTIVENIQDYETKLPMASVIVLLMWD